MPDGREPGTHLLMDLRHLHETLGSPEGLRFMVVSVHLEPLPTFMAIRELPKGDDATSEAIMQALQSASLFQFRGYEIQQIGG